MASIRIKLQSSGYKLLSQSQNNSYNNKCHGDPSNITTTEQQLQQQPQKQRNNNTTSQQQDGSNNNGKNNSDGGTVYQITSKTTRMDPIATEEYPVATAAAADQQSTAPIHLAVRMVDGLDHLVESPPFLLTGSSASFSTSNAINERT